MPYSVKILKDSIAPCGKRLTTWELTYPRMVHAELMTHRLFSRNSASSRAIPTEKLIQRVLDDPAMPVWWGANQKGMQAAEELSDVGELVQSIPTGFDDYSYRLESPLAQAKRVWLEARDKAVACARELNRIGLHKQIANRVIEPWMFITVIVSATEFDQWFHQRYHKDAQPEIKWVAENMWPMYEANKPVYVNAGMWHLPLVESEDALVVLRDLDPEWATSGESLYSQTDKAQEILKKVSVGRCARVSYLTHDGKRDLKEDIGLHDRLRDASPGHWSPFEHVAMALDIADRWGNFIGWKQYRKFFIEEHKGGSLETHYPDTRRKVTL